MAFKSQTQLLQEAFHQFNQGRYERSEAICRKLLKVDRSNADILHLAALTSLRQGKTKQAIKMQHKAIKSRPSEASLYFNLANMLVETNQQKQALFYYRKAISLQPDTPVLIQALIDCLTAIDEPRGAARHHSPELEEAAEMADRLFQIDDHSAGIGIRLAGILMSLERLDEAETVLKNVLDREPGHVAIQLTLVQVFMDTGRFDEAENLCLEVLKHSPINPQAYLHLSNIRATAIREEDVDRIRKELKQKKLSLEERTHLNYSLARYFDAIKKPEEAFPYFAAANAATLEINSSYIGVEIEKLKNIRRGFNAEVLAETRGGCDSEAPVFIVGMPRSGTSLLEQILASHPSVFGCGELGDMSLLAHELHQKGLFPEGIKRLGAKRRTELGRRYLAIVTGYAGVTKRVVDKMPQNFMFIGLIHLLLPKSKIIHCKRDPVATCFSNYTASFSHLTGDENDLEALGKYYRAYENLMDHWSRVLPNGRILDVGYETLVEHPEPNIRRILDHCNLPWDDNCVTFYRTSRNVRTASAAQVRQPMLKGRSERWRLYEKNLSPLLDALGISQAKV